MGYACPPHLLPSYKHECISIISNPATTSSASRYTASRRKPNSPGDARLTSPQIIKDEGREGDLTDKTALITGYSSGLGIKTAWVIKVRGVTIFVTARNLEKAKTALGDVLGNVQAHLPRLDLKRVSRPGSARSNPRPTSSTS